jgi:hypothetical protein
MRVAPLAAALAALLAFAPAGAAPGRDPQVVEQVVAVIRTPSSTQPRVVTLTRLEEESRIALISRGGIGAADQPLDGPALRAGLEWLIDQMLLQDEVVRLQVFEVDRAEVLEELRRFQGRFPSLAAYRAFLGRSDLTEEELLVVLRRMVRVQRYVDSRISGAARVKEAEVDRTLAEKAAGGRADDPAALRTAVRAKLTEDRTRREVRALLGELRGRAEVRVLERFGEGAE